MRIRSIGIQSVLNYDAFELDFGEDDAALHILYGPNEAGKSTLLQVLVDLLFGGKIDEAFRDHYDSRSRIEGILEHPGLPPFHVLRKKRYSRLTLTDGTQPELPEDLLIPYLGGYDKERFTLLFGFDHARLRHGGESLLQSGGHAGISLFETGGGVQYLQTMLKNLSDRSNVLLDPNFMARSTKLINKEWRAYKEAEKAIQTSGLRGEDWDQLRRAVESSEKRVQQLQGQKLEKGREISKLQRIQRVRNLIGELRELRDRLSGIGAVTVLSPETDDRILEITERRQKIVTDLTRLKDKHQRQIEVMKSIVTDPPALENESEIDTLNEGLQQYVSRKTEEIPKEENQLEQLRRDAVRLLKSLSPDIELERVEQLRIPFADEERVLQLSEKIKQERIQVKTARERYEEVIADKAKIEADLMRIGEPKDVSELRRLLQEIRANGDVEEALSKQKLDIERRRQALETALKSQSVWTGSLKELKGLTIPLLETIDRFHKAWTNAEKELEETKRNLNKARENLSANVRRLEELELGGRVPVEADLLEARKRRDTGWQLVKQAWLQGDPDPEQIRSFAGDQPLSDAFEAAMDQADNIADWMRRESERSAQRAHLLLLKEQLEREIAELEEKLERKDEQFAELELQWRQEWVTCGIEPKTPAEMKEWLTTFYRPLLEGLNALQAVEDEYTKQLQRRDSYVVQLLEALTALQVEQQPADVELKSLLQFCDQLILEADEKMRVCSNAQEKLRDCEDKLVKHENKLRLAKHRLEEAESEWRQMRERYPSLPEDPEVAVRYIGQLRQLFQWIGDIERIRFEIDVKRQACERFEDEARALADRLAEDLSQYPSPEAFVRRMRERLRAAKDAVARLEQIWTEVERLDEEIHSLQNEADEYQVEIESYMKKYGCANEDELRILVQKSVEHKQLDDLRNQTETRLRDAGDGLSVAQLEAEVAEVDDPDLLSARMEELQNEVASLDKELENEQQRLWELKRKFNELDGSRTDAADYAQKAEAHLAEVDRLWNEYLRVELARRLLQRAIEQFRQQNESSVLERAGEFFRQLTLGRYKGLTVEYDGNDPYIEAIHADGTKRRVHQMSDGTRDQLFLSMRLAFVDQHLTHAHPLPLIMDDILVHFDDDRTRATLEILHDLAGKTQILYFTHHRLVVDIAQKLTDTSRVRVHDLALYHKVGVKK
jgi:uncharacterized protein YhaN